MYLVWVESDLLGQGVLQEYSHRSTELELFRVKKELIDLKLIT
jgi:hypothetical protein